jgi:mycothiol synthase
MTAIRIDCSTTGLPSHAVRIVASRDLQADLPALFAVAEACRRADGEIERGTLAGMRAYYRTLERFDPARDVVLARIGERIVGYARVQSVDSNDGERWYESTCHVHPDARRRGLGRRMLAWTETRRLRMADVDREAGRGVARPRWLTTFTHDGDVGGVALLGAAGYEPFRRFHSMRRPDFHAIPDAPLPESLEIRPIPNEPEAIRAVVAADSEAFRDHFGAPDDPDSVYAQITEDADTDVSLWVVAFDGDEIAGGVLNGLHLDHAGVPVGWLDSVFTRRPWRRRGLARALISRSLRQLRDRGLGSAALGVDAANPNQALRLYRSCGFEVASSSTAWRRPLPSEPHEAGLGVHAQNPSGELRA